MSYKIVFTKQAAKDYEIVRRSVFSKKAKALLTAIESNPYKPPLEKLIGELDGAYSRRLNKQHRIVYRIMKNEQIVIIISMWTHYE